MAQTGVVSWSTSTGTSNGASDSNVNWAEGMAPAAVNDSARNQMASVAMWRDDISGKLVAGGTSTAYSITSNQTFSTLGYLSGQRLSFSVNTTNGSAATLNVDGLGAKALQIDSSTALPAAVLQVGQRYDVSYNSTGGYFLTYGIPKTLGSVTLGAITATSISTSGTANFAGVVTQTTTSHELLPVGTTGQRPSSQVAGRFRYNSSIGVPEYDNGSTWISINAAPTRQVLTSGSGATYTTPTGCIKLIIKMVGGGGGGGAAATNNGTAGNDTSFNSIVADGGAAGSAGGASSANGGNGAGGASGAGSATLRIAGGAGDPGRGGVTADALTGVGGNGGDSAFGGGGAGGIGSTAGGNGATNSGAGGGGGGHTTPALGGGGGGAGEYVELEISSPSATYTYTVAAAANGGSAGTRAGGNGGSGLIIVEEYY